MGLRPDFRLVANSADVTETIRDRLISINMTDKAGIESDTLEVAIIDDGIALPPTGAELELWLGYEGNLRRMGVFVVDELTLSGPPDKLVIRAKALVQDATPTGKKSIRTQKTRAWEAGTTLAAMAGKIATEHGLALAASAESEAILLPHVDQVMESDIHLLTRLAKDRGLLVKAADGKLVIKAQGNGKTVSGASFPTVTISLSDVTDWSFILRKREAAGEVQAIWQDVSTGTSHQVTVGEGEPIAKIRHNYSDEASASAAAKAEHTARLRGEKGLRLSMPGDPLLVAEAPVELIGFKSAVTGEWTVDGVTHAFRADGYTCTVSCK